MPRKKKIEEVEVDQFKVQKSINSQIDAELNRIWQYLKENVQEKKEKEESNTGDIGISILNSMKDEINQLREDIIRSESNMLSIVNSGKNILPDLEQIKKDLELNFTALLDNRLLDILKKTDISIPKEIIFSCLSGDIKNPRIELGYAEKGNIVFYKKAFSDVIWHLPDEAALVSNTGFVALKNGYWIVIGEDSEGAEK